MSGSPTAHVQGWKVRKPPVPNPPESSFGDFIQAVYGGLPPAPDDLVIELLNRSPIRAWPGQPVRAIHRLGFRWAAGSLSFCVQVLTPPGEGPFPVVLNGDGCWPYLTEAVARSVLETGCAVVQFNRTECFADTPLDLPEAKRRPPGGLPGLFPDLPFGAIAAWAWGLHRCVDLIYQLPKLDRTRIAVTGHSRGGKTALLAAATDPRITLVNDNASGAGGGALSRLVAEDGETFGEVVRAFPQWFAPGAAAFADHEEALPGDQNLLLAALAPRPVLHTYALEDPWSNPAGMILASRSAREVYRQLDCGEEPVFHLREGVHRHDPEDWAVLLDFIGWKWFGRDPVRAYNRHPYGQPELRDGPSAAG